jgi:hypothetical protein
VPKLIYYGKLSDLTRHLGVILSAINRRLLAALCRDRRDRRIGWRIVPLVRFLRAIEGDDHAAALWRFALESLDLVAANEILD